MLCLGSFTSFLLHVESRGNCGTFNLNASAWLTTKVFHKLSYHSLLHHASCGKSCVSRLNSVNKFVRGCIRSLTRI